jgi:hypothetical protein
MKNIVLLLFLLCFAIACIKEGPPGPKGPDGPPYTWPPGNITGYIELYDQFGLLIERGDSVLLNTYNADSVFSTYSDSTGHFKLGGLPPGNYDITISKPGFDSLHLYVQHAGGMSDKFTGITTMSQHVTTNLISLELDTSRGSGGLIIDVDIAFEWPQPFIADQVFIAAFLDTSSVPGSGRSVSNFTRSGNYVNIDNVKGTAHGFFRVEESLVRPGSIFYVTAVVVPPIGTRRSWFNYTTGLQVPYPYPGDSIKAHTTQLQ